MTATQLVFDPVAPCLTAADDTRRALDQLAGKVVGFIDNAKPNFHLLADDLSELLVAKYGVARVVRQRKRSASQGLAEAAMNELATECDAVITGSGD
jgi:hypothetical protein